MESAAYTVTDPTVLEERFAEALTGGRCGVAIHRLNDEQRSALAAQAKVLLGIEIEAMEMVGRLANSIAIGCEESVDVAKLGNVLTYMAGRARFHHEVCAYVDAMERHEPAQGHRAPPAVSLATGA
jgi:hypothetical protein